jgi:hypothetical protein
MLDLSNNTNINGSSNNTISNVTFNTSIQPGKTFVAFDEKTLRRNKSGTISIRIQGQGPSPTTGQIYSAVNKVKEVDVFNPIFFGGAPVVPQNAGVNFFVSSPSITNEELDTVISRIKGFAVDSDGDGEESNSSTGVNGTNGSLRNFTTSEGDQSYINNTSFNTFPNNQITLILPPSVGNPGHFTFIVYPKVTSGYNPLSNIILNGSLPVFDAFINLGTAFHTRHSQLTEYYVYMSEGAASYSSLDVLTIKEN